MPKDTLFQDKRDKVADFEFGRETTEVFEDMLDRSVPFYREIQRMMGELATEFSVVDTNLYDLGCSTGTTLAMLDAVVPAGVRFVGVDSSPEMLEKAADKLATCREPRALQLIHADLNHLAEVENASVVVLCLTLQFVRPLYRHRLMQTIAEGIRPGGCLILVEKVLEKNSTINRLFIKNYYAFKERVGYSEMEIAQKREALENVLVPYRHEENLELLRVSGFSDASLFFKWYNFCGILAVK